jgi:drug/metabolite transporter (DMT)-like permease
VIVYRFLFAVLPFLPILLARGARPRRRDLWLFALTGFLMVPVTFVLQFGGLMLTSATSTALMIGTGAPLLALAAVLFEGERLGRRGWTALAISCLGVLLLVGAPGAGDDWRGNLMVLLSMFVATVWVIMSKRLVGRYRALHATGWILLFGTLFLIPIALAWKGPPPVDLSVRTWASLVALGLGCTTLAYVLWNWGVARAGAARAGIYLNLEPIVGALLGVAVMGDAISGGVVVGGILILAAAGVVSRGLGEPKPTPLSVPARGLRWWLDGRPSLHAALTIRLYGGGPIESHRGVEGPSSDVAQPASDPRRAGQQHGEWRPHTVQLAVASRVSFW